MGDITPEILMAELRKVRYPGYSRDIVSFGIVKGVKFHKGIVSARLELTTDKPEILDQIKADAEMILSALPGVNKVFIETRAAPPARAGAMHAGDANLIPA